MHRILTLAADAQRVAEIDRGGSWGIAAAVAGAVVAGLFAVVVVLARRLSRAEKQTKGKI